MPYPDKREADTSIDRVVGETVEAEMGTHRNLILSVPTPSDFVEFLRQVNETVGEIGPLSVQVKGSNLFTYPGKFDDFLRRCHVDSSTDLTFISSPALQEYWACIACSYDQVKRFREPQVYVVATQNGVVEDMVRVGSFSYPLTSTNETDRMKRIVVGVGVVGEDGEANDLYSQLRSQAAKLKRKNPCSCKQAAVMSDALVIVAYQTNLQFGRAFPGIPSSVEKYIH